MGLFDSKPLFVDSNPWVTHPTIPEIALVRIGNHIRAQWEVEAKHTVTFRSFSLGDIMCAEIFNHPNELWSVSEQMFHFDSKGAKGSIIFALYHTRDKE